MTLYVRDDATDYQPIDRWDGGVGWLAHPEEVTRRASHAVLDEDGRVWVIDPIDAPGLDELLADLGPVVAGVAVLSAFHSRDAGDIAARHDVPVYLPEWMDEVGDRLDVPITWYDEELGDSGFRVRRIKNQTVAFRESDRTLYVGDLLGTTSFYTVGDERVGVFLLARPFPPRALADYGPHRIIVGHGTGVFEDAASALDDAISGARRRFPRALVTNGVTQVRATTAAIRHSPPE